MPDVVRDRRCHQEYTIVIKSLIREVETGIKAFSSVNTLKKINIINMTNVLL